MFSTEWTNLAPTLSQKRVGRPFHVYRPSSCGTAVSFLRGDACRSARWLTFAMRLSTPPEDVADFVKDCRRDVRGDCCEREAEVRFCERVIGISIELLFGCVKGRFLGGKYLEERWLTICWTFIMLHTGLRLIIMVTRPHRPVADTIDCQGVQSDVVLCVMWPPARSSKTSALLVPPVVHRCFRTAHAAVESMQNYANCSEVYGVLE